MESTTINFDCPISPWFVAVGGLLVLGMVLFYVIRDTARMRSLAKPVIRVLQAVAVLLLIGLALGPKIIETTPDEHKPKCAVLVDTSRSMLLRDTYKGDSAKWLSERFKEPPADSKTASREEVLQTILKADETGLPAMLARDFDLTGSQFSGADAIEALALGTDMTKVTANPEGYASALGEALHKVTRSASGQRPSAVVLLSDGAWNSRRDPTEVAGMLGRTGVPVFVIGVGDPHPPRDVAIFDVKAPRNAILGEELMISAQVAASGSSRIPVKLMSEGVVLAEKSIMPDPAGRSRKISFNHIPDTPGEQRFVLHIDKQRGEVDETNNTAAVRVEITERTIKVLMIESSPRWEYRFVQSVLDRDPSIEVKVCLIRPGIGPIRGPGYIGDVPRLKSDLAPYDLVILGDVARERLSDELLKELASMVRRRGAGLVIMAGRGGHYRGLVSSPLAAILPVKLEGAQSGGTKGGAPFSPELTQDGLTHLCTRLAGTPEDNAATWTRLPKLRWSADVASLARGATSLLVHSDRVAGTENLPLISYQRVGSGKVLFFGIEETWRWRKAVGDLYHYRFWAQTVRWLTKKQFSTGDKRARLSINTTNCNVGESVEIEAFCLGTDGFPLESSNVRVVVTHDDGTRQVLAMQAAADGWGIYRASFTPEKVGRFRVNPIVPLYGEEPLDSEISFEAARPDLEKHSLAQNEGALKAIAEASGGRYVALHEVDKLSEWMTATIERHFRTTEYSPCRNWIYYTVLALVLAGAWFIRKRSGLA